MSDRQKWSPHNYEAIWHMYQEQRMAQVDIAREVGTDQALISRIVRSHPQYSKMRLYNRRKQEQIR